MTQLSATTCFSCRRFRGFAQIGVPALPSHSWDAVCHAYGLLAGRPCMLRTQGRATAKPPPQASLFRRLHLARRAVCLRRYRTSAPPTRSRTTPQNPGQAVGKRWARRTRRSSLLEEPWPPQTIQAGNLPGTRQRAADGGPPHGLNRMTQRQPSAKIRAICG